MAVARTVVAPAAFAVAVVEYGAVVTTMGLAGLTVATAVLEEPKAMLETVSPTSPEATTLAVTPPVFGVPFVLRFKTVGLVVTEQAGFV